MPTEGLPGVSPLAAATSIVIQAVSQPELKPAYLMAYGSILQSSYIFVIFDMPSVTACICLCNLKSFS